jgi:hypothetical protein
MSNDRLHARRREMRRAETCLGSSGRVANESCR